VLAPPSQPWSFNRPVGLGGRCAVSANLKRHFGLCFESPFDGWYTPLQGLIDCLVERDPLRLCDPHELVEVESGPRIEAFNTRYWLELTHAFPHDADERLVGNWRETPLDEFGRTICRRWEYFLDADPWEDRILFVRLAVPEDIEGPAAARLEDLTRLEDAIANAFPQVDFRIAFLNYGRLANEASRVAASVSPRFAFAKVRHKPEPTWEGPPDEWDAALRAIPYRYDPAP